MDKHAYAMTILNRLLHVYSFNEPTQTKLTQQYTDLDQLELTVIKGSQYAERAIKQADDIRAFNPASDIDTYKSNLKATIDYAYKMRCEIFELNSDSPYIKAIDNNLAWFEFELNRWLYSCVVSTKNSMISHEHT